MFLLQRSLSVILCFLALLHLSHCLTCYKCKGSVRWWLLSFWDICYFLQFYMLLFRRHFEKDNQNHLQFNLILFCWNWPSIPHFLWVTIKITFILMLSWNWPHIPVCLLWATYLRPLGRAHGGVRLKHRVLHTCHEAAGVKFSYLFISFSCHILSLSYLIMSHIIF